MKNFFLKILLFVSMHFSGEFYTVKWGHLATILLAQEQIGTELEQQKPQQNLKNFKRSFIGIELGQTMAQLQQQLSRRAKRQDDVLPDSYYYFLYDLYVSEIEEGGRQENLLEVKGNGFVSKGVFQFALVGQETEPKLVAITIFLDPQWSSYEQILQKLTQDYGNPQKLNPQRSIWQDEQTVVTLEKQLRYKILDKLYLEELQAIEQREFNLYKYNYQQFLEKF